MPASFMKFLFRIKPWGSYWNPILGSVKRSEMPGARIPWEWRVNFEYDEWFTEREDTRYQHPTWSIVPRV